MDKSKLYMVQYLVARIEAKLGWGPGANWSNSDFEALSEHIFADTKRRLSVTTLKRIWGRAERIANPSSATLNILSEYIGHKNWREFVHSNEEPSPQKTAVKGMQKLSVPLLFGAIVVLSIVLAFYWPTQPDMANTPRTTFEKDFTFKTRTVSQGLPNSVVFEYDVSEAPKGAKIEIQQDWDNSKRISIGQADSVATCIYYRPGFFKSKLVVDGTIVKEADVFIKTTDWLGTLERDSIPIYLNDVPTDDQLAITAETVAEFHLDPRTTDVMASFYLVKDLGELHTDDFELSLQLKNTFENGRTGCRWAKLFVLYDGGAIGIPLAKKGCSANLDIMAFGDYIDGKTNDLSGLGVDFTDFITLRCVSKDGQFQILVNDEPAYQMATNGVTEKIRGLSIHFEGAGTVKQVVLGNTDGVIYAQ